ncbi:Methylmalonyl-CoA carboxyltransferase 1.3S subunit [Aquisphaera giovannonii]|uniref:Methylmalonyl-CoA carboxyltransferase 1.3S subunit n=1 Tax=Aquisphaera giovannonii TaxID=406548 RepID=A0A5B9VVN6_9BACT|nr:biotin/lipoyl-containing protein [Aquisphaera giovannonii]QEH31845.1 Methylmalonyl-CoA carboxyltransferase 1.3S subunit [Aquisphaera giovannonii]
MKLKISVDGKQYEVDVEVAEPEPQQPGYYGPGIHARVPAAAPVAAPPPTPAAGGEKVADEAKVCRSPFSGTVSKISAQPGQSIQVNDTLLVLEAMKMETVITAPIAGKVARINVNVGDAVQQGQVLVEFE